ncbi:MAG: TolC family outer membrane protein [Acidiferrobacter sp.]
MMITGSAHGASLLRLYRLAQGNDPTFRAARYALAAAFEQEPEARAALLPHISATGSENRTRASTAFAGSSFPPFAVNRSVTGATWAIQLTQPLIHLPAVFAYREARWQVAEAQAHYQLASQDLILRVAHADFRVLVADAGWAAARAQVRAVRQQLAQAIHGYGAGTDAITDIDEARARLGLARAQQVAARTHWENARAELAQIVGPRLPRHLAGLTAHAVIPVLAPRTGSLWVRQAERHNPGVVAARATTAAARDAVQRVRGRYWPTLDLVASVGHNDLSGSLAVPQNYSTHMRSWEVGVQLNAPIFTGGLTTAQVAAAIDEEHRARAQWQAARRQAATAARKAYSGMRNGLAQIRALRSAVASGRLAVKGDRIGYRLGIRISLDVLHAEHQLYTARRDLARARYATLWQGLALKAAAGLLSEADVATVSRLMSQRARLRPPSARNTVRGAIASRSGL